MICENTEWRDYVCDTIYMMTGLVAQYECGMNLPSGRQLRWLGYQNNNRGNGALLFEVAWVSQHIALRYKIHQYSEEVRDCLIHLRSIGVKII